ncbi:MAG: TonB-dependent receptor [Acidobacteria bacterium]|nr:TonB-dependent receptor [Acidobacteriota bacterium]
MKKAVLAILAILISVASVVAQTPLGRIVGTVRDQTGAIVPNAKVTITNEGTGQLIQTSTSNDEGVFTIPQLPPASYTVKIETAGFKTGIFTEVKVEPSRDYSLVATLEVGGANETVQVTAGTDLVNTSSPDISSTVIRRQIVDLPLNGRNPIELIRLQAGVVGLPTRTNTTINGGRPTWTQVTQDGINIQDNFIRTNSLDFVPNRPTSDTIGEFTITTNTQGADSAGGASQVKLVTPSGTSEYHGSLYEFNRNSALSANSWFNNATIDRLTGKSVARPFLNRNQFGGNIGGPVILPRFGTGGKPYWSGKDKLFFFFSYEGFRQRTQTTQNNTIPVNNDFLTGTFRYVRPSDNTVQSVNVLSVVPGLTLDPKVKSIILDQVPSASLVNNFDVGNSSATRLLNTAGYRFLQSDVNDRNQYGMRFDYQANDAHRFEFIHTRFKETDDRTDLDAINRRPKVFTSSNVKFFSGAWRWAATPRLNNELRIGANLAPVAFESSHDYSGVIWSVPFVTNREVTFQPQGRDTRTFQYIDNASWVRGDHAMQFGGSLQRIKVQPYNFAGRFPTVNFGFSPTAPTALQLTAANFPGGSVNAADLANANALRTFLTGVISSVSQTFQVKDKTSGYIAGIPNVRDYLLDNYSFYLQDNWKIRPNLSLRLGLKWEYFAPLKEESNLQLLPIVSSDVRAALLNSNGSLDFVNGGFYNKDLNNFGPSVGLAWDPFNDGKTSIRAGYTMTFVNEETITVGRAASDTNAGLASTANLLNLYSFVNAGIPTVTTPTFKVPRTYADQLALSLTGGARTVDPNIKQPFVHQISFGIEREIFWDMAVEARYVGTMGRDVWRGIELNQLGFNSAFLQDFNRARSNGFIALNTPATTAGCTTATCGVFNPAYNTALPGSQQLTVLPNFGGGLLTVAGVRTAIQTGQPASLASTYITTAASRTAALAAGFLPNPGLFGAGIIVNGGTTDYNALQLELRRRFKNGIFAQANYTFSKVLTNSPGTAQNRFEPFVDNARQNIDKVRADFDVTHVINASTIFELPFGSGHRFLSNTNAFVDRIIGGWQVSSIVHYQSGAPISILSGRATFSNTGTNPAVSTLNRNQIKDLFGIRKQADGRVYYIDPKVIDTNTGRAVGPDRSPFSGQVFFHPNPGEIGNLQRLQFDGPSQVSWDFSANKRIRLGEKPERNLEFRADLFNFLNHPLFFVGDHSIESTQFGRITGLNFGARVVQVALKLNF